MEFLVMYDVANAGRSGMAYVVTKGTTMSSRQKLAPKKSRTNRFSSILSANVLHGERFNMQHFFDLFAGLFAINA